MKKNIVALVLIITTGSMHGVFANNNEFKEDLKKLHARIETVLENQRRIVQNQADILAQARLPREQHTHYGFLSPHPVTALCVVGIPVIGAIIIVGMLNK